MTKAEVSAGAAMGSPTATDRYVSVAPGAQERTFGFDTIGHATSVVTPEQGTVTNTRWNALGQVTEMQDALGTAWGHEHRTSFDGAGRPVKVERVVTDGATPNNVYAAGNAGWVTSGSSGNVWRYDHGGSTCLQRDAWYIGTNNCQYAKTASTGTMDLDSPSISLPHGAILTFNYFREVRDEVGGAGNHDIFRVRVQDQANVNGPWIDVLFTDSSQVSWPKWVQSPAISLDAWAGKSVKIRFEFDSVAQNGEASLRGVGISQVVVRRPASLKLQETVYDESFNLSGNRYLGKPTTVREFDEATQAAIFTRELHYVDVNGRLSDERLIFDWDRDGTTQPLIDDYRYDSSGTLESQRLPHATNATTRRYYYNRAHGALNDIQVFDEGTGTAQHVTATSAPHGFEYNDAGGLLAIYLANGLQQHVQPNSAFLPNRIWVDSGIGTPMLFDTGIYSYDGAHNITQTGDDLYRYDAAGRLTWSSVTSSTYNTVDLNQVYDVFGNMTAQTATRHGGATNTLPFGLEFSGRTYANNRISNSGFAFDANGNLVSEPAHDSLAAQSYQFNPDGRLVRVTDGAGKGFQSAAYEGDSHRWFRSTWAEGSKALITLRDASGKVVADFMESNATSGLVLQKEYVHADGRLLAINSACGPRPALKLSDPATANGQVWFDKTDYVTAVGTYTIFISTDFNQSKTLTEPSNLANHFGIAQSEFWQGVTNYVSIESDAACGHTGYSNAVSYVYAVAPQNGSCLTSVGASRTGFNGSGSSIEVGAQGSCATGTVYNIYFQRAGTVDIVKVNPIAPLSAPKVTIGNVPCGSGEGDYWLTPIAPGTTTEGPESPKVTLGSGDCGGGGDPGEGYQPGRTSVNLQFVHADHLGSTRAVTDEHGVLISSFKYFPFGMEAETSGDDVRQKFTGHERDDRVGLDYMLARSYSPRLSRFLSPDPYIIAANPQECNRYAYAANSPVSFLDATGELAAFFLGTQEEIDESTSPALVDVARTLSASGVADSLIVAGPRILQPLSLSNRAHLGVGAIQSRPYATLELIGFSRGAQEANRAAASFDQVDLLVTVDPEYTQDLTVPRSVRFAVNISDGVHFHGEQNARPTGLTAADPEKTTVVNLRLSGPGIGEANSTTSHGATATGTKSFVQTLARLAEIGMLNKTTLLQAIQEFNNKNRQGLKLTEEQVKKKGGSE